MATSALFTIKASAQIRDHVALAQDLLRAAFPDLSGELSVGLNSRMGEEWRMAPLTTVAVRRFDPTATDHSRTVLSAYIQASSGELSEASFFGEYVDTGLLAISKNAQLKGGDIAANVVSELKSRGAKYIPSAADEFLAAVNIKRLSVVLGAIQDARARFVPVPPFKIDRDIEFLPIWLIDLTTSLPAGKTRCYTVFVDPVTLRLTRISAIQCKPSVN